VQLARVTGTVVATIKTPGLQGVKLLLVQPLDRQLRPSGGQVVAADAVHMAGPGELVYIVAAREAAQALPDTFVPVDHAIVGIVDAVTELPGEGQSGPAASDGPSSEPGLADVPPARRSRRSRP
jgi:ethanolamine utilization protein EutN